MRKKPKNRSVFTKSYDVIIIGAGISGLVCGCYLSKAGMKVLIIEQHDKPGGYCTSFRRKEFVFDAAAHSFGSCREEGNFRAMLGELNVDEMITIKRFSPSDRIVSPDFTINFWNDTEKTICDLTNHFPKEEEGIRRFFDFFQKMALNQFAITGYRDKTFGEFLGSFFQDKRLIYSLSLPIFGNGGLPPSLLHAFTGIKIFGEFIMDGGYYCEGGMQKLSDAFAELIIRNEGVIIYKNIVKKILHDNKTATGVRLGDGREFFSKHIVSACDVSQTFNVLLGSSSVSKKMITKLNSLQTSISTFVLYIGIRPFEELTFVGTNVWYLPFYDIEKIYEQTLKCSFEDRIESFMIRISPDRKTITAYFHAPFKTISFWRHRKQSIAESFLGQLEKIFPRLRNNIVYIDAATPQTLARYTFNKNGADYGWAPSRSQLFDHDFSQRVPVKGLHLTGHWTSQTHGIPGVSYLGRRTAKRILQREDKTI